ncbi:MAG: Deoxyribodipyrimidine photo-lyase [Promethearchaeota archaeon]|nr:MAG: Deoxyribodipyrimidine photo-lyase [Candidatus Lokiarchaeota archaeon]
MNKIQTTRVRKLTSAQKPSINEGAVLYWMSREQRIEDNWAFLYAQEIAIKRKKPLIVLFCLLPSFMNALFRAYKFMIEGLQEIEQHLKLLHISFIVKKGSPETIIPQFSEKYPISTLITDFSPLKTKQMWITRILDTISCDFYEIDAHNIIPVWEASSKKEYAAYTLRNKIQPKLKNYLVEFPKIKKHFPQWKESEEENELPNHLESLTVPRETYPIKIFKSGEAHAKKVLTSFLKEDLKSYTRKRNDPNADVTSNLSPYLHFGQISSQRVVLEAQKIIPIKQLKNSFYDEIIVRKELSDNFCYYEPNYDSFEGFHSWAQETLNQHREDTRDHLYTQKDFETANTHDEAWNAAQLQMIKTGKMHGYMRMYWGKKILEWTESPEEALEIAIYLNDKYELDGRDPNGYTGIAWSIGGIHDRAWKERKVYGKIRYMSYNGLKRKFDVQEYINTYLKNKRRA